VQDRDPAQGEAQLVGRGQHQMRGDLQLLQHDVGLHEAVERTSRSAGTGEACGHVAIALK
jgi:hypothetical protein